MKDVIIIGGGPVGLQAARCLAQDGFEVEVVEEHRSFGEPVHCTGILAPEIFTEFGISPGSALNELRKVRFYSPKGQRISYLTDDCKAVVVDRRAFDRNLLNLAQSSGAHVEAGVKAAKIEIDAKGVAVHCAASRTRKARACLLASGAAYTLHRDLNLGFPPVYLNCAQLELPAGHPGDVEVHVGRAVAPKGFAWAVPVLQSEGSYARIGLMCDGNVSQYFKHFLSRLNPWAITGGFDVVPRQRMLPLAPIRKTYGRRFLVAGDAAGFVKPTTGGGVYYGMISAGIAASVLSDALHRNRLEEADLCLYQKLWRERLMEEIEAQLSLRLLMQKLTDDELETIFHLWSIDGLMPLIRKTAQFNHYRKLIVAITRNPAMRRILFRKALA